ncbi:MAG: hypothetical protein AAGA69_11695, partial [Pseudomonadota bacterium]
MFFPNLDQDGKGIHKEGAYRGLRPPVLDAMVYAYCELREIDDPRPESAQFLCRCRRLVVSGTPVTVSADFQSVIAEDTLLTKSALRLKGAGVDEYAGLWLGSIFVTGVSEAQLAGVTPLPVSRPFVQKLLIHVDANGQARLLKEVVQMAQPAVLAPVPDDPNNLEIIEPGREVLVTDDSLLPNFEGLSVRDGQGVGVRHSTTSYDFEDQFLDFAGAFNTAGVLSVTLDLPSEFPTNPFLHRYHP